MLYTMQEAAEILKTNVDYVHELRRAGLIRCIKLGRWKVRKTELERFIIEHEGKDVTDPHHIKDTEGEEVYFETL